jgi:peptidoglycan/xylan/chitin deacetylase (PgdA/CDA1 family)
VALTFDDGPDRSSTPAFLDLLRDEGIQATFFVLGRMLRMNPEIGSEIAAAGHEIAVHGWNHRPTPLSGPMTAYDDLARTTDLVSVVTGTRPRWYRPPYGVLSASALGAARRLDLTPVLWTTWGRDWRARATPGSVTTTVARDLRPGGTILLHDSDCTSAPGAWRTTLGALPAVIAAARARGLAVGPLREHLTRPSPDTAGAIQMRMRMVT